MTITASSTVVVIGGSSGIGFRVAELAGQSGANLVIGGRDSRRLAQAAERLQETGTRVTASVVDAHDEDSLAAFFSRIDAVDHVVSLIGDPMGGGFLSASLDDITHTIDSKFFTNLRVARLAAPLLREGGSMVFTSGTGGRSQDAAGSYVGNLAIKAMVEGLAVELAPHARANAVAPTWTDTPLWAHVPRDEHDATKAHFARTIPLGRTASIDEVARAYLFLMSNDFVTGQQIDVDGGVMLGG